jgi:hypothetical protein
MHLLRHRADRDGLRRHRRRLGVHGSRLRVRRPVLLHHRHRHRGSYRRRRLLRADRPDGRRRHRAHGRRDLASDHRDDRWLLAVHLADAEACCRGLRRGAVHRLVVAGHPDGEVRLHPEGDVERDARRAAAWRRGCCRREVRGQPAWVHRAEGPGWALRGRLGRPGRPGWRGSPPPAAGREAPRRPRARRQVLGAAPARRAAAVRRALALPALVRWPRHHWWTRHRQPPSGLLGLPLRGRASSHHPMPRGAGGRRAPRRLRMLI